MVCPASSFLKCHWVDPYLSIQGALSLLEADHRSSSTLTEGVYYDTVSQFDKIVGQQAVRIKESSCGCIVVFVTNLDL